MPWGPTPTYALGAPPLPMLRGLPNPPLTSQYFSSRRKGFTETIAALKQPRRIPFGHGEEDWGYIQAVTLYCNIILKRYTETYIPGVTLHRVAHNSSIGHGISGLGQGPNVRRWVTVFEDILLTLQPDYTDFTYKPPDSQARQMQLHYYADHCTALHCTALHCTALHCTVLHYTALCYTTLHYTALHYTVLHYTALYYTALHCTAMLAKDQ